MSRKGFLDVVIFFVTNRSPDPTPMVCDICNQIKWGFSKVSLKGDSEVDFGGDLVSSAGQVKSASRSGLVQVRSRSGSVYSINLILLSLTLK